MAGSDVNQLTEEEKELYDRQIRLWGLESQKRLRGAKVLLIGLGGLGAEIVKNIVLAGINALTLMDTRAASELDINNQFLIPRQKLSCNRAEASVERAQALNPLVNVTSENADIFSKPDDYVKSYDVVVATGLSYSQTVKLDSLCRLHQVNFFACNVIGLFGYALVDLGQHDYVEETVMLKPAPVVNGKRGKPEELVKSVKRSTKYPSLEDALEVDFTLSENSSLLHKLDPVYFIIKGLLKFCENENRDPDPRNVDEDLKRLKNICHDLATSSSYPTDRIPDQLLESVFVNVNVGCAIVGGIIGQEVIRVISQVDLPIRNILYFDPIRSSAAIFTMGC